MGKDCGEGKEGASMGSGKESTEATSIIKYISTIENGTGQNTIAFSTR